MLTIQPSIRLIGAMLIVMAVFLTKSLAGIAQIYTLVVLLVLLSHVGTNHFRFVGYVSIPLLLALIALWGLAIDSRMIPLPHKSGVSYAFFLWLRIVSWGGVLQFVFVPLVNKPSYFKDFLVRTGLGGSLGTLIIASVVFLPEMRRRLSQVIDARHAQGISLSGLNGLKNIPTLLMPLVSSLLDTATKRAELWSHRGIMGSGRIENAEISYSNPSSGFFFVISLTSCLLVTLV